jgi:HSP20 family protein
MLMKREGHHWVPSIFNDFFNSDIIVRNSATAPAINVFETEKEYKVEVAAAGMRKEDFRINIDSDNDLTITMEKDCNCKEGECCNKAEEKKCDDENCETKGRYLRREFSYTKFQQTLILPEDVVKDNINASMCDGVLCIELPRKTPDQKENITKVIEIK